MRQCLLKLSGRQEAPHKPRHCRAWPHLCLCAVHQAVHNTASWLTVCGSQVSMTRCAGHSEQMQNAMIMTDSTASTGSVGLATAQCGRRRLTFSGVSSNCSSEPRQNQSASSAKQHSASSGARILTTEWRGHTEQTQTMWIERTGRAGASRTAWVQAHHSQWRPMCGRAKRRWSIIPSTGLCPEPHNTWRHLHKDDRSHQAQTSSQPQNRLHSNAAVAPQKLAQKQVR